MMVGLFLSIIPFFPGITVIWLAALIYGIVTGFNTLGIVLFVLITIGMLIRTTSMQSYLRYYYFKLSIGYTILSTCGPLAWGLSS